MAMTDYSHVEGMRPDVSGYSVDNRWEPDLNCDDCTINKFINSLEPVFNIVFMLECVCKIIAFGFVQGKTGYLKDSWNKLDFFVVLIR